MAGYALTYFVDAQIAAFNKGTPAKRLKTCS